MSRTINNNITPNSDAVASLVADTGQPIPVALIPDANNAGRCALELPDAPFQNGPFGANLTVLASGFQKFQGRVTLPPYGQTEEGISIELKAGSGPFPPAPDRQTLLGGQLTGQGLYLTLPRFGTFPWWPPCWAWLTQEERASVASQLLALGEELTCVEVPCGPPLYDEADQFYSTANGFGPLDWTNGNTALDPQFVDLIAELIGFGFKGVWIFLGGDAGQDGVPIAMAQTALMGPALAACPLGNLNAYVVQLGGWDGTWHKPNWSGTGWTPDQFAAFADSARAHGAIYVGMEHAQGYEPVGEGDGDFLPGGHLYAFSLILGEYDGGNPYTPDSWQLLGRLSRPYVKMPGQGSDDPDAPYYLAGKTNADGAPFTYRVFEFAMYPHVRWQLASVTAQQRQVFIDTGAIGVC